MGGEARVFYWSVKHEHKGHALLLTGEGLDPDCSQDTDEDGHSNVSGGRMFVFMQQVRLERP